MTVAIRPRPPLGLFASACLAASSISFAGAQDLVPSATMSRPAPRAAVRLRWLTELGAESIAVAPRPEAASGQPIVISVPGAAYVFDRDANGELRKRKRLAADSAAPHGVAVAGDGVALADRLGTLAVWSLSGGDPSPRWRRDLGDRVTSVGWDGGPLVFAATWKGRLEALAAADGHSVWSIDLGGRAEAPAVADGNAVFVATKSKALVRIDAATGTIRWRAALPGMALHAPTLVGAGPRLVVCGTWDGQLLAYESVTGRTAWSAALGAKLAGAPLAFPGHVAVVTSDGAVRSYDLAGRPFWAAPGAAEGPAALLLQESPSTFVRIVVVSRTLVGLNASTGERLAAYPQGALEELRRRFADAMLDGVKTYSEAEKHTVQEREAFEIAGPLFASARRFGPYVAFGTEEGWAYLFDATVLRPSARYHAGQPASSAPRLVGRRVLAVAGEDVYALGAETGDVAWKRTVGGDPGAVLGDATLGVVAGGRVQALGAADGNLGWSLRGRFRFLTPPAAGDASGTPWLVEDGEGQLRALASPGRFVGAPLPIGGDPLAVLALSSTSWLAATRDGRLCEAAWTSGPVAAGATGATDASAGSLAKTWEKAWGEPLADVQVAGGRVLVRSAAGSLVNFDPTTQQEGWRLALAPGDRLQALPQAGVLLLLGADSIGVHDWASGELKHRQKLSVPALAADLRGSTMRWLDRQGRAYHVALGDAQPVTTDLGVALAEAVPLDDGFLVTTAAGEVGRVEVAAGEPSARFLQDPGVQSRGVTR